MNATYIISMIAALGMLTPGGLAMAEPSEGMTIRTEVTGATPTGRPWDGRGIYALPVQMGYVSPPDLAICIFELGETVTCHARDLANLISNCPDRDWCEFDGIKIGDTPLGIVIYDLEPGGYDWVKSTAGKASTIRSRTDDLDVVAGVKGFLRDQAGQVRAANEKRMEYIDAVIFNDTRREPALELIGDMIRLHVSQNVPFGKGGDLKRDRISGPIAIKHPDECTYPAPECQLDYSFIQLIQPAMMEFQ